MEQSYTSGEAATQKTKTHFARIIVTDSPDTNKEPYYEILYYDPEVKDFAQGYGSYNLENVSRWLNEYFEVVGINDPLCFTVGMPFGYAIEAAKMGRRIARKGWNGKGMAVAYQKGYPDGIPCNTSTGSAWGMKPGTLFKCQPYLQMRCADGTYQMWVASQSDILADDWYIVD